MEKLWVGDNMYFVDTEVYIAYCAQVERLQDIKRQLKTIADKIEREHPNADLPM